VKTIPHLPWLFANRLFLAVAAATAATPTLSYPTRPVRLLVPFSPGGGNDFLARILGQKLGDSFGQQVVIDNRPGGGGIIANDIVAKAAPDGYTLLLGYFGPLAVSPSLQKLPYDPVKDFTSLGILASGYHILVIHPSVPARSVKELIALAKAQPGKLNSAFSGVGAAGHLATELFRSVVGIEIVHVPYRGSGPAAAAVMAGEAHMQFGSVSASMPYVRANRLIALATTSPTRLPLAPEVPTLLESGITGVNAQSWYTLLAPSRTSREVVDKLGNELRRIVALPDVRAQLARQAIEVQNMSSGEFTNFLQAEITKWGKVVRTAGIKVE
jgi:tripartite-type tricarboxylate transporter receptor subunit TctC